MMEPGAVWAAIIGSSVAASRLLTTSIYPNAAVRNVSTNSNTHTSLVVALPWWCLKVLTNILILHLRTLGLCRKRLSSIHTLVCWPPKIIGQPFKRVWERTFRSHWYMSMGMCSVNSTSLQASGTVLSICTSGQSTFTEKAVLSYPFRYLFWCITVGNTNQRLYI